MADSLGKIPPHNLEAESAVLCALLIDHNAILKVGDLITPEDFYHEKHGIIFSAMLALFEQRESIDLLSVANRLKETNELEVVGNRSYLAELTNTVATSSRILQHAQIVKKDSILRKLISVGADITSLGFQGEEDIETTLDAAQQKLYNVTQRSLQQKFVSISTVLSEAFERIDELHKGDGKLRGIASGFKDIDYLLAGFQPSNLIILAARPSVGKTSLALDMARYMAVHEKAKVGILSLEMSKEELVDRILCAEAGVDLWRMRTGKLSDSEDAQDFPKIGNAMGVLSEAALYIDDSSSANLMEIRTKARRMQMESGLDVLFVDYLQLMEGRNTENRVQEISEISRGLKLLAKELRIPIIAISQLSRAVESRNPAIPKLSDLRDSGSIEQDADVVMFIYRKKMDKGSGECPPDELRIAEISVAKHRNGPVGGAKLFFKEETASFRNLDTRHKA
ncbi:MAG: replicative DNA helicase [Parcubacteria group bacterium GW2011_GWA2_44_12]|nr:MAG: replicative DNA helicase [Parcubacteria group bacterium GW2011_GWA2_44_12]